MCNRYRYNLPLERLVEDFSKIKIPLRFPEGRPNLTPQDYAITDRAPIVRADLDGVRLDMMRWSWPQGPYNKPVFNFRSDGRRFPVDQRCLIPTDGFYEYTASTQPGAKAKDRWLFTMAGHDLFAIAGVWRGAAAAGKDAWAMLTTEPGPDIAPYQDRQVVLLYREQWGAWLGGAEEANLLVPSPAGTLTVLQDRTAPPMPPA